MFAFACIAGGFIVACTVVALLVPLEPEVTLSDIARQMEIMHRSRSITSSGKASLRAGTKLEPPGQVGRTQRVGRQTGNCD